MNIQITTTTTAHMGCTPQKHLYCGLPFPSKEMIGMTNVCTSLEVSSSPVLYARARTSDSYWWSRSCSRIRFTLRNFSMHCVIKSSSNSYCIRADLGHCNTHVYWNEALCCGRVSKMVEELLIAGETDAAQKAKAIIQEFLTKFQQDSTSPKASSRELPEEVVNWASVSEQLSAGNYNKSKRKRGPNCMLDPQILSS